jgi:hypothetical protein
MTFPVGGGSDSEVKPIILNTKPKIEKSETLNTKPKINDPGIPNIDHKLKRYKGELCHKCGRKNHIVETCKEEKRVDGSPINYDNCFRCGKKGHWKPMCDENKDVHGRSLSSSCIIL